MSLKPETRTDLRDEKERLLGMKRAIETRIQAIEQVLVPEDIPLQLEMDPWVLAKRLRGPSPSLRSILKDVLTANPQGLAPRQIAPLLIGQGLASQEKTSLIAQISNELWRMEKRGELERVKKGIYRTKLLEGQKTA